MNLPTREECFALMKKYEMPERIKRHSLVVNKICMFLAGELKKAGEDINLELIDRASLLHDIGKIFEIRITRDGGGHGAIGYEILCKEGYPEVAKVVRVHVLSWLVKVKKLENWEEKVVKYADIRVNDDKIVSIPDRYEYLRKRYVTGLKIINASEPQVYEIEKEIFEKIRLSPDVIFTLK